MNVINLDKMDDKENGESERNSSDICVSPVLNCSLLLKVQRNKGRKIKRIVEKSPDLSKLKQRRKKIQVNLNETMNELKQQYEITDRNTTQNLENHRESKCIYSNDEIVIHSNNRIDSRGNRTPCTLDRSHNLISASTDAFTDDVKEITNSPILNFVKPSRNIVVDHKTSNLNRRSIRKQLFANFCDQFDSMYGSIKKSSCSKEMAFSGLDSNSKQSVKVQNQICSVEKINYVPNKVYSPVNSTHLKDNSSQILDTLEQSYKWEKEKYVDKCFTNNNQFENISQTLPISPDIKSTSNTKRLTNFNDLKSLASIYSSTDGNYIKGNSEEDLTISEFPSPCKSRKSETKSYKIRNTANFDKVWSIEKKYFENIFKTSISNEDSHISDHSSPESKLTPNSSNLSNRLDERHLELSHPFAKRETYSCSYNSQEKSLKKNICNKNSVRRILRKKKYSQFNLPALEIIHHDKTNNNVGYDRKLTRNYGDQITGTSSQKISAESHKLVNSSDKFSIENSIEKRHHYSTSLSNADSQYSPQKISGNNCRKVENIMKNPVGIDTTCQSIADEREQPVSAHIPLTEKSVQSDVNQTDNDSVIITNNTLSCSQATSDFVIESISSPSVVTSINKTNDEIQFSDASSLDKECKITPKKDVMNLPAHWDDVFDSASKKSKRKYPENSLAARMITIKNRFESDVRLRQHMLTQGDFSREKSTLFSVKSFWQEYSRTIILCRPFNEQDKLCDRDIGCSHLKTASSSGVRGDVHVLMDSTILPIHKIINGTLIRIHPPWNVLHVPEEDMVMVLGATCLELVPQTSAGCQQPIDNLDTNTSTLVTNFNCLCLEDLRPNVECRFQLLSPLPEMLCSQLPNSHLDVNETQHKRIPRLYFFKQYEGTLGSYRAFHLLNPDVFISVKILTTFKSQTQNRLQCEKLCAIVVDEMEEIGAIVLSTETDVMKWRTVILDSNGQLKDKFFKITGVKISLRVSVKRSQLLKLNQLKCSTDQLYVYYFVPVSDWWTIYELNPAN